jgi:hypothetical protein
MQEACLRLAGALFAVALALPAGAQAAPKPDLAASKPGGVPASAAALDGFKASIVTRNLGRGKARPTRIAFFLSKDRKRSVRDLPFATELRVGRLKGGKRASRRGRLVIPLDATGGRWFVVACVDDAGLLRESREGNNCAASRRVRVQGPDPLKIGFTQDAANAAQVETDTARTLTAVGADGTIYTLDVSQRDAESVDTLKITPIAGIAPAPGNVTPRGGIAIEPAGILLDTPALLRIEPPQPPAAAGLVGFASAADGSEFHLVPAAIASGAVQMEVTETGVAGFGAVRGPDPADEHLPAAPEHRLSQAAAVALATRGGARTAAAHATFDRDDYAQRACDYYKGGLEPRLIAATTQGKKEVVYALVRETGAMLHNAAVLGLEDLKCTDGYLALFEKIIRRVFDESYNECKTAGGDPFDEGLTMLSMVRQGRLLGFSEDLDSWLGPGAIEKIVECSVLDYDVGYSAAYATRTDGGWSSTGGVSAPATRITLDSAKRTEVALNVPDPSATFFGDCGGSYVRNDGGTLSLKGSLVVRQRYKAGTVNGRYDPQAEVELEREVRIAFFHRAVVVYRIDCGGGPSDWDLAGDGSGIVRLPPEGGSASAVSDSFPPQGSQDVCVECERSTGTVSAQSSAR